MQILCENNLKNPSDSFSDSLAVQNFPGEAPHTPLMTVTLITDKSCQEATRGFFYAFSIKILFIRPYSCVVYPY